MDQLPQVRVYVNLSPQVKFMGCVGCLMTVFIVGGIVGVLLFGWKTLLGM